MPENNQIAIVELPTDKLGEEHFELRRGPMPTASDGELVVRNILLSLDAANRAWMQGATYRGAVHGGDLMPTYALAEVIESKSDAYAPGDLVSGESVWADYAVMPAKAVRRIGEHRPLSHHISLLGVAGKTAYHGLMQIGEPGLGETVVVSAAAGSVGSFVGQIAKNVGARAVGIAGGPDKCAWLTDELGFDAAVDYKAGNLFRDLKAACPDGIDVYFDNVGGEILEAALFQMNLQGRIVCCGAVSQYDTDKLSAPRGVPGLIVVKRLKLQGYIVSDYADHDSNAERDLRNWFNDSRLRVAEDIIDGLENAPSGLIGLLNGANRGKRMIRLSPDP